MFRKVDKKGKLAAAPILVSWTVRIVKMEWYCLVLNVSKKKMWQVIALIGFLFQRGRS